jgi:cytochrome c biogenesis protein CcmG/thiol:disulfide interchange protein DsbE
MTDRPLPAPRPSWRRLALPLLAMAVFAGVVAFFAKGLGIDSRKLPSVLIDKPAPAFDLPPLLAGTPGLSDGDLKGRVTLVNVWASWCIPCRVEHPVLMRLARDGKAEVVGINWKDKKADAETFLKELGNPFARIGFDQAGRVGIDWGVYGVPETYVIDRTGRIRHKVVGPITPEELNGRLTPLIESLRK